MINYFKQSSRQSSQTILDKILVNHPPWALPSYVVDTGENNQLLYFCQNLQAVSWILNKLGNGEDRAPDKLYVNPFNHRLPYVDESNLEELFYLFIKADEEHSNWVVVFEYTNLGPEYEILSM